MAERVSPASFKDGEDRENENELADHTALRSPEAARRGDGLTVSPPRPPEGSAGRYLAAPPHQEDAR